MDLLTGFLNSKGNAMGRPVGVINDGRGGVLVADDVGNVVWRVSKHTEASLNQETAAQASPGSNPY